jgi:hypothetical protein
VEESVHLNSAVARQDILSLVVILSIGLVTVALFAWLRPIENPDAFDYIQIAMHLADGNGFSSGRASVAALHWLHARGFDTFELQSIPMLSRYPLPIVVQALFIRLGFAPYVAGVAFSALGYLASAAVLYVLCRRLFQSAIVSTLLVLGAFLAEGQVGLARSGLTEPVALFFFLSALAVLISDRPPRFQAIAVGILAGLGYLNRTQSLFYTLPLLIVGLFPQRDRPHAHWRAWLAGLGFGLLSMLLVISPWLIRNMVVTGAPTFSLDDTYNLLLGTELPAETINSSSAPVATAFFQYLPHILAKFTRNLHAGFFALRELLIVNRLVLIPFLAGMFAVALWAVGSVRSFSPASRFALPRDFLDWDSDRILRTSLLVFVALLCNFVGVAFFLQFSRLYALFWPFVPLFAFIGLCYAAYLALRARWETWIADRTYFAPAAAALASLLYMSLNLPLTHPVGTPDAISTDVVAAVRASHVQLCQWRSSGGVVISDVPSVIAVEAHDCNILVVPYQADEEYSSILDNLIRIRATMLFKTSAN